MVTENLKEVLKKIELAKRRRARGLKDNPVTLVAVTKNHGIAAMREAIDAGVTNIGENRVQEAKEKFENLERDVVWHLIGHLQTNKVNRAVKMFKLIHSVDSLHLAKAINDAAENIGKIQEILVQINLYREESKFGCYKEDLMPLLKEIDSLEHLKLKGLMLIAPNFENKEDVRPLFKEMYDIFTNIKNMSWERAEINELSMGMTGDYEIAIEEGATMVRVGIGIFGERIY